MTYFSDGRNFNKRVGSTSALSIGAASTRWAATWSPVLVCNEPWHAGVRNTNCLLKGIHFHFELVLAIVILVKFYNSYSSTISWNLTDETMQLVYVIFRSDLVFICLLFRFDDRSGRWCNYSSNNNSTIDQAYQAGNYICP